MKLSEIHAGLPCQVDYAGGVYTGTVVDRVNGGAVGRTRLFNVKLDRDGTVVLCAPRQIHRLPEPTPKVAKGATKPVACWKCPSTVITGLCDMGGTTPELRPACQQHADPTLSRVTRMEHVQVTSAEALEHMLTAQRGKALRAATQLLSEVQRLVQQLEAGDMSPQGLNASTVGFVMTDHAQLITLRDALEVVQKEG